MRKFKYTVMIVSMFIISLNTTVCAGEIVIKDGEKIGFMGDSITAFGWNHSAGYVRLVVAGLKANGVNVTAIPAGAGGHKSNQMLGRLDRDVLQKKPDWMTLSCGVNDVWHGPRGVKLEDYKKNMTAIVDKCKAAGVKVMILTPTLIGEQDIERWNTLNAKLDGYVAFLKEFAKERQLPIADLNGAMKAALNELKKVDPSQRIYLTTDGVHMNPLGDIVMAKGVLRSFGFNDAMLEKAEAEWDKISFHEQIRVNLTLEQYKKYSKLSGREKHEAWKKVKDVVVEAIK